jgi:hypothetical protein
MYDIIFVIGNFQGPGWGYLQSFATPFLTIAAISSLDGQAGFTSVWPAIYYNE